MYGEYDIELEHTSNLVNEFEAEVVSDLEKKNYEKYAELMEKANQIKSNIDKSMMFVNFSTFMSLTQFNDLAIRNNDTGTDEERRRAMVYLNDLHNQIYNQMERQKNEQIDECKRSYEDKKVEYEEEIKKLKNRLKSEKKKLSQSKKHNDDQKNQIESLKAESVEKTKAIESAKKEYNDTKAALESEVASKDTEIKNLIKLKQDENEEFKNYKLDAQKKIEDLAKNNDDQSNCIDSVTKELEDAKAR